MGFWTKLFPSKRDHRSRSRPAPEPCLYLERGGVLGASLWEHGAEERPWTVARAVPSAGTWRRCIVQGPVPWLPLSRENLAAEGAWLEASLAALEGRVEGEIVIGSSALVYGDRPGETLTEASTVQPTTTLGRLHQAHETAIRAWARDRRLRTVTLRSGRVIGTRTDPRIAWACDGIGVVCGEGTALQSTISADDYARLLLDLDTVVPPGDCYLIADGGGDADPGTYLDFITAYANESDLPRRDLDALREEPGILAALAEEGLPGDLVDEWYALETARLSLANDAMVRDRLQPTLLRMTFRDALLAVLEELQ